MTLASPSAVTPNTTVRPANAEKSSDDAEIVSYCLFQRNQILACASVSIVLNPGTLTAITPAGPALI